MDASPQSTPVTVYEALPWLGMTLDYTDKLVELLPEELLDTRPADPSGHFFFSFAELAMHIADARSMFARQLAGSDSEEGYWSEGPGEDDVWQFKPHGGKQAIVASLAAAREELQPWGARPVSELLAESEGTRKVYQKYLDGCKEKGKEPDGGVLRRGPANIMRVLMGLSVHEAGHRGALQTLLRLHGVDTSKVWGE